MIPFHNLLTKCMFFSYLRVIDLGIRQMQTRQAIFFVTKPTRCTNFTNLFCHETLRVSDSSSVHHQEFILCTLSNGTCHSCHLWPAPLCIISPHYFINGTIFEKKVLDTKSVFWFYLQLLSETFLILRREDRHMITNVYLSSYKVPFFSCPILKKLSISRQIFEKYSNMTFHENPSNESRVVPCGRTDRQTKLIVAFRNFAKTPKHKPSDKLKISASLKGIWRRHFPFGTLRISSFHLTCPAYQIRARTQILMHFR
jgi:hypothetical protein